MSENIEFTDSQWYAICNLNMSLPILLEDANLEKPFIYDRKWGVFYVPRGYHQSAMSLLLAFHYNCRTGIDVGKKLNLKYSSETADYWLENISGTAFLSSVGKKIYISSYKNLSFKEKIFFKDTIEIFK